MTVRAVLNETLRLFPPIPLNSRESRHTSCTLSTADPTFPSVSSAPLYMPKNTTFMYMPILTQRNPALWGKDADVFDPERWLDPDRLAKFTANPMMFTPFSAGPRIVSYIPLYHPAQPVSYHTFCDIVPGPKLRIPRSILFPCTVVAAV